MTKLNTGARIGILFGLIGGVIGAGAAFLADILTGSIVCISVIGVFILMYFIFIKPGRRYRKLLTEGITAKATVTSLSDTGVTVNNNPQVKLGLRVHHPSGLDYDAETRVLISRLESQIYQSGLRVAIKINPANHQDIILLTTLNFTVDTDDKQSVDQVEDSVIEIDEQNKRLTHTGVSARGKIVETWLLPYKIDGNPLRGFKITVLEGKSGTFTSEAKGLISGASLEKYSVGKEVIVKYDKKNRLVCTLIDAVGHKKTKTVSFIGIIITLSTVLPILIPVGIAIFEPADTQFADMAYVPSDNCVWQVDYSIDYDDYDDNKYGGELFIYIFDVNTGKKVEKIKEDLDPINSTYRIYVKADKVWLVSTSEADSPLINVYDATSFEKVMDLDAFCSSNSLVSQGIASVYCYNDNGKLNITTLDGIKMIYDIKTARFFGTDEEYNHFRNQAEAAVDNSWHSKFIMVYRGNNMDRKELYTITADSSDSYDYVRNLSNYDQSEGAVQYPYAHCSVKPITPGRFFLKSYIVFQDNSMAVIFHHESMAQDASLLVTGIDINGKEMWTVGQDKFPNADDIEDEYSWYSSMRPTAIREGNLLLLSFDRQGMTCVEISSGKVLWTYEVYGN